MPTPSSGLITLGDIATEFGGSAPYYIGSYYSGGANVPAGTRNATGNVIPTSGPIYLGDFYGAKKWNKSYVTLGDGVGTHNSGNNGTALLRGANTTSGGNAGMPGTQYISSNAGSPTGSSLYAINLSNTYFPLLPTISDGTPLNTRSIYCLGTGVVSPAYDNLNVPIFVWRTQYSNWTDDMIRNELGLSASQVTQVKYAERVWWENAFAGMDNTLYYGLAVLDSRNYLSGTRGNPWANKTIIEYAWNYDVGGEWSSHGFIYAPTISGTTLSNTGTSAFTITGSTFRDGGGVLGSLSDYTVTLNDYSLVVPVVKSDNGFSGGARDSNRNPFSAKFGYIALT